MMFKTVHIKCSPWLVIMHTSYDSTIYSFITFFLQVKQYKFSVLTLGAKYCVALFTTHAGSFP